MSKGKNNKTTESGSIFTVLMGGIAMVALVSLAAYQTISGPVASASRVTQLTMAKSQLASIGSMTIMDAANQTGSGDCDSDGHIEPRPWRVTANAKPTNGGLIPLAMGAPTIDPWGMDYGYCAWDVGPISADPACGGGTGMLDGANDTTTGTAETLTVLAIISAGPDRSFDTTCNNYVDASTDLITTDSDDIITRFTYSEASSATGSLWKLKAGDASTAALDKNLEIGNDINFDTGSGLIQALSVNTTGKMIAGGGLELSDETVVVDGACTGGATAGLMRFNDTLNEAQLCLSDGTWDYVSTAGVGFPILAPDGAAGAPNYSFANYTDAGFYHEADGLTLHTATTEMNFGPASGTEFHVTSTGGFQIGDISMICDDTNSGVMRYVESNKAISFCDGENWTAVSPYAAYISVGYDRSCGSKNDGALWCWGAGGTLGDGTTNQSSTPVMVSGGSAWKAMDAGYGHSCGIKSDDTLWCWGDNTYGQLGDNTKDDRLIPVAVSGGGTWKKVSTSDRHSCGIKSDDTAWCWGDNWRGKLGDGTATESLVPVSVSGGDTWKVITAGSMHSCGIKSDDSLWCWGRNNFGQLGDGTTDYRYTPVSVSGGGTWKTVSGGSFQSCGIKSDDTAWCWGGTLNGQLGEGSTAYSQKTTPQAVSGGGTWKVLSAHFYYGCGIKSDDTAWCWGSNSRGQLGDGTTTTRSTPTLVSGNNTWRTISGSHYHTCGIKSNNTAWCWGQNDNGQVGDGTVNERHSPVAVSDW